MWVDSLQPTLLPPYLNRKKLVCSVIHQSSPHLANFTPIWLTAASMNNFGFLATFSGQLTPVWSLSSSSLIWVQPLALFLTPSSSIEYLPLTLLWFQSLRLHSVHTIPLLHIPAFPCQFWCAPELFPGPLLFISYLLPFSNIFPCIQHSFPLLHGWRQLYICSEPNSPSHPPPPSTAYLKLKSGSLQTSCYLTVLMPNSF